MRRAIFLVACMVTALAAGVHAGGAKEKPAAKPAKARADGKPAKKKG